MRERSGSFQNHDLINCSCCSLNEIILNDLFFYCGSLQVNNLISILQLQVFILRLLSSSSLGFIGEHTYYFKFRGGNDLEHLHSSVLEILSMSYELIAPFRFFSYLVSFNLKSGLRKKNLKNVKHFTIHFFTDMLWHLMCSFQSDEKRNEFKCKKKKMGRW